MKLKYFPLDSSLGGFVGLDAISTDIGGYIFGGGQRSAGPWMQRSIALPDKSSR